MNSLGTGFFFSLWIHPIIKLVANFNYFQVILVQYGYSSTIGKKNLVSIYLEIFCQFWFYLVWTLNHPLPKLCGVSFDNLWANGDGILKIYVGTNKWQGERINLQWIVIQVDICSLWMWQGKRGKCKQQEHRQHHSQYHRQGSKLWRMPALSISWNMSWLITMALFQQY